ncbi:FAD-dependent oxidoreductase [Saccharopolyspora pogona]|uniref:FAD-dependent oxidoreductase n=1 Tax=Saccharopolyspora pogona TaxID=333966 RepID=UPI0037C5C398
MERIDVVVIGAGQAGLTGSYHLQRTGIDHVVLDHGDGPGGAWRRRWPSLRQPRRSSGGPRNRLAAADKIKKTLIGPAQGPNAL